MICNAMQRDATRFAIFERELKRQHIPVERRTRSVETSGRKQTRGLPGTVPYRTFGEERALPGDARYRPCRADHAAH